MAIVQPSQGPRSEGTKDESENRVKTPFFRWRRGGFPCFSSRVRSFRQPILILEQKLRRLFAVVVALLVCVGCPSWVMAQTTYYTDFNNAVAGLGTNQGFAWDTSGSGFWNTSNVSTNTNNPIKWGNAATPNNAVFGAGTATGAPFTATLGNNISVGTVSVVSDSWVVNTTGSGNNVYSLTFNSTTNVSLGSSFVIQGAGSVVKDGSNTLTLSGSNTYSGGTTVNAGTLALASTTALNANSPLTLTGGTLLLSAAGNYSFGALTVNGNATIDFGSSGITNFSVSSLSITSGSLTITNWVRYSDTFVSGTAPTSGTNPNTVTYTAGTQIPKSIINFSNYGELAQWNSGSFSTNNLAAVPEPSTYGAIMMAGCAGLIGWRRWRRKDKAIAPSS